MKLVNLAREICGYECEDGFSLVHGLSVDVVPNLGFIWWLEALCAS